MNPGKNIFEFSFQVKYFMPGTLLLPPRWLDGLLKRYLRFFPF
jgi:hypothetical protein